MKKKKDKPILYRKYLQNHKEEEEKQELNDLVGHETETIIVHKISAVGKILQLACDVAATVIKTVVLAVIVSLISLGVTVLLNPDLRNILIETVNSYLLK